MGLFDAIASSVGNLTDNVLGMVNQNHQNKVNLRMMREQNAFNADQAAIQRQWQTDMWNRNNRYNSPDEMISRGLNPFVQGSTAMANQKAAEYGADLVRKQGRTHYWESVARGIGSIAAGAGNFIGAFRPGANIFRNDYGPRNTTIYNGR
jgi:hypothetical protein